MRNLTALLDGEDPRVNLDLAALELATLEYPDLDPRPFLDILDSHAAELSQMLNSGFDGAEFVAAMNDYLFNDLGFEGSEADYQDPRNSCLNEVLARRVGIPITLSLVYMEIARRLGRPVYGIGLPGHFIVQYDDGEFSTYIDPFHRGRTLEEEECIALASQASGLDVSGRLGLLDPVGGRYIAVRMLNNLRGVYLRQRAYPKLCGVLSLLITATPESANEYVQRGVVNLELKQFGEARKDLETYLRLAPQCRDRVAVEKQIRAIDNWLTRHSQR